MPGAWTWRGIVRIGQFDEDTIFLVRQSHQHPSWFFGRFDAVIDGVFQQRLQQQRRHQRIGRAGFDLPLHDQAIAKTQILQGKVLPGQRDLFRERHQIAVVAHQDAEQVGQFFKRHLGATRIRTNDTEHGVERVEQKVGANARR